MTIFPRIGEIGKHIEVLMASSFKSSPLWMEMFYFTFVFYNLFWKFCVHLVLIIYFQFILPASAKKWRGGSKSQSFELPHTLCFFLKLEKFKPLALPATVVIHGYLMIMCKLLCIPPSAVLISVGNGSR